MVWNGFCGSMMGYGGGGLFTWLLFNLLLVGLVIAVFLWIVKLWNESNKRK